MKLTAYLALRKIKQVDLADGIKVHPVTVNRILGGDVCPRKKTMDAIVEWSKGEVTLLDLCDEFYVNHRRTSVSTLIEK